MKNHPKGQGILIKVTSLAIGLTVGLVLIVRVELNRNYDRCIADKERVYQVCEMFQNALIAIPSVIVGVGLGWYFSGMLMEQFADKIRFAWYVFAACALFVLLVIAAIVLLQTYRVATSNPVNYLKTE